MWSLLMMNFAFYEEDAGYAGTGLYTNTIMKGAEELEDHIHN
ncbi:hypothetical protein [Vulcanisaeta moutnovskia]|nr:hypothetical protein [Vulcanisaeta moutnovskia]